MKILHLDLGREMRGGQRQVLYLLRRLHAAPGFSTLLAAPRGCPLGAAAPAAGRTGGELPGRLGWGPRARRRGSPVASGPDAGAGTRVPCASCAPWSCARAWT